MSDYKFHLNHKFSSCQHIANARDTHRGRDVKLFHMPGNFEYVGIFDGIDAMICPVSGDPYSANVARILNDIREGKQIEVKPLARTRNRVDPQMELPLSNGLPPGVAFPRTRVRIMTESPPCATHATPVKRERNRV